MRSIFSAITGLAILIASTLIVRPAVAQTGDTLLRIENLLRQMTLEEKVHMVHANSSFTAGGIRRLGIPELVMSDGPHGVRPEHGRDWTLDNNLPDSGTYLPTGVCLAATWNPQLGLAFGKVLGSEARYRGKDIILGPGINIIRSPLNGRNFEYQSEDPFLVSRMVVSYVQGVQTQGVGACVKHFAANNQENKRTLIDVHMSERAFREIYLPGFRSAVQDGGAYAVMGSYNRFRGQWASQNYYLLTHILRKEWGYRGLVMSDWNANNSTAQPFWNGLDLEMGTDLGMLPNPDYGKFFMADTLVRLIRARRLPEYLLDEKVRRLLYLLIRTGAMDADRKQGSYHTPEHREVAARIAEEGIVLLRNEDRFLPLNRKKVRTIAVIGANADRKQSMGGGSSQVRAFYEVTPLQGIRELCGNDVKVLFAPGYEVKRGAVASDRQIQEAVALARSADAVIYVGGSFHGYDYSVWADNAYDAEDTDKPDMYLPFGQDRLIRSVVQANPKTAVVLFGGGATDMSGWFASVPSILQCWYPGMEGGRALARILFGAVNPSGKLPMTFPKKLEDHPAHQLGEYPGDLTKNTVYYYDDIYVGYRYYDTYGVAPLFPFGHGLSYTQFTYDSLRIVTTDNAVEVRFIVRNTGTIKGADVAQVYVHPEQSVLPRPDQELKGFSKVELLPGESKELRIRLGPDAFSYYNDLRNDWVTDPGSYTIRVGASSRDIRLSGSVSRN